MNMARAGASLARLGGVRVLCVGDLMLDRFVEGRVERISPEAPIPVLAVDHETAMAGGAGNVARNLSSIGAMAHLLAVTGDDAAAAELAAVFSGDPSVATLLVADPAWRTPVKTRYRAGSQQILRADRESRRPPGPRALEALATAVTQVLPQAAAVMLSDYGKGTLSPAFLADVIAAARAAGIPVIVDPKGRDYGPYGGASLITPNRRELAEATGQPVDSDDDIAAAARHLIKRHGIGAVLATRSQDGMTLVTAGEVVHLAAYGREVFDVSGAGDTVAAVMAAGLGGGLTLTQAAFLANVAAGIVVGKTGTAVAHAHEIAAFMDSEAARDGERGGETSSASSGMFRAPKILRSAEGLEQIAIWRRRGQRIGFTNGCFDLLHPGHVSLLRQARAACDRLVVGLNADVSVRRLKGPSRPVQNEQARAAVLASLADVDMVLLFEEETPLSLIEAVRPDILVKGADYARAEVVGGDLVESYGGKVMLAEMVKGFSTTAMVDALAVPGGKPSAS